MLILAYFVCMQNNVEIQNIRYENSDIAFIPRTTAYSLCLKEIEKISKIDSTVLENVYDNIDEIIFEPVIKQHMIVILYKKSLLSSRGQTCIINNTRNVTIMSLDYEAGFNRMILEESITVASYDKAVNIAKLFIKMMFPLISKHKIFFAEEFDSIAINTMGNANCKNHINVSMTYDKKIIREYFAHFKKALAKRSWFARVCKKNHVFIVDILCFGSLESGGDYVSSSRDIVFTWQVKVFSNGTIETKLPKGVNIYKLIDQ